MPAFSRNTDPLHVIHSLRDLPSRAPSSLPPQTQTPEHWRGFPFCFSSCPWSLGQHGGLLFPITKSQLGKCLCGRAHIQGLTYNMEKQNDLRKDECDCAVILV